MAKALAWNSALDRFVPIPEAKRYVICHDRFMSGWGDARGKSNWVVVPCDDDEQVDRALKYIEHRSEMDHAQMLLHPPRSHPSRLYSIIASWAYAVWRQVDIRYNNEFPEKDKEAYYVAEISDSRKEGYTDEEIAHRYRLTEDEVRALSRL